MNDRNMSRTTQAIPRAFTLVELLVVLILLVALAGVVVPLMGQAVDNAEQQGTRASLQRMRAAIMGDANHPGYYTDLRRLPRTVADLYLVPDDDVAYLPASFYSYDPIKQRGWRGPYLATQSGRYAIDNARGYTASYGDNDDPASLDGWLRPIVLQRPTVGTDDERDQYVRLVSAGPDGVIDSPTTALTPTDLTPALRDDDVVLFLRVADDG